MKQSPLLLYTAVALVLILAVAVIWLLTAELGGGGAAGRTELRTGTIPGLDLRYGYDPAVFTPAPYDGRAEFPLRLDAEGFSFYGKRIRGAGLLLEQAPQSQLYDFVGTEDAEVFESYYGLKRTFEKYEDADIGGKLALHTRLTFEYTQLSVGWPSYFPDSVKAGQVAHLEGWALFSAEDLFYFYAVAPEPLAEDQRSACLEVLNSLEFNALLGSDTPELEEPDAEPAEPGGEGPAGRGSPEATP
ncbi:MAG TPA: hypothetical protein ENO21_03160 [Firmicutes bacterium]|nr:hypothetical protein [Bacillota bacterium]